jgi:hypothetical protein
MNFVDYLKKCNSDNREMIKAFQNVGRLLWLSHVS